MPITRIRACSFIAMTGLFITAALYWRAEARSEHPALRTGVQDTAAAAVKVTFIGESLCPDCAAFTTDVLDPVYSSDLKEIVDLDYVGWGNAKNNSGTIECQHGRRECKLNKALNCAQHKSRSQEDFFIFLLCLEKTAFSSTDDEVLETCSSHAKLDEKSLRQCMDGKLGEELEIEASLATPAHQYVPWILVDGVPLAADCGNLATYVCLAYKGKKPQLCSEPQPFHACPGAPSTFRAGLKSGSASR